MGDHHNAKPAHLTELMKPKSKKTKAAATSAPLSKKKTATQKTPGTKTLSKARGRPTSFTPDTRSKIIAAVSQGNTLSASALMSNISDQTLRNWLKSGEQEEHGEYAEFALAIKQAQAKAEMASVEGIRAAAQGGAVVEQTTTVTEHTTKNGTKVTTTRTVERFAQPQWQAAAFMLERRNPQQWGRHDRVTNTNYNFDLENLSDEQFELFDQLTNQGVEPPVAYATVLGNRTAGL
jgi:hypothetical protein